ncbi:MAG TPA: hypothetical protein H9909_04650 [Candidatus Mediterraneibacter norfolkensis]|nr:hypothetical protein [Candidatus Mediterraneibacter norfolkensis]
MKTKKKRWLAILSAVIMVSAMLPTTVFASSWRPQLYVNGEDILSAENNTVACGNGTAVYDSANNTLTLNNATITKEYNNNYGIYARDMNLNIVLVGTNSVSATNQGIYVANSSGGSDVDDGYLNISGSGSIEITAGIYPIYGYKGVTISGGNITCIGSRAISTEGALTIENASITGICTDNSVEDSGIVATQNIVITNSTVSMQGYFGGINSILSGLSINGGSDVSILETIGNAINTPSLTIDGSKLTAKNTGYVAAVYSSGNASFKNGNVEISSVSSNGLYADETVTISGGTVTSTATGDYSNAIYAYSTIEIIDGATVTAKATSENSGTAIYGYEGVSVTDSNLTAKAGGDVAVYSPSDVTIEDSIVTASAPNGRDGIRANGSSSVTGSWVSTSGDEDFGNNITDSVLINGNSGRVIGSHALPEDVTVPAETTVEFTEGSGLTVPTGVTFTNNGTITGDINITNNGTIICNNHTGGTATCTEQAVCAVCDQRYGDLLAHELTLTEKVEATCTTDGKEAYYTCENCGKHFEDEAGNTEIVNLDEYGIIPATDHEAGTEWKSDGNNHWNECVNCGERLNEAAHSYEWVVDKEATATEAGSKHEECTVCGYAKAAIEIPATGTPTDPSDESEDKGDNTTSPGSGDKGDNTTSPGSRDKADNTVSPGSGDQTGNTTSPETGDDSNIALSIAVMLVAGTTVTGTILYNRKRKYSR